MITKKIKNLKIALWASLLLLSGVLSFHYSLSLKDKLSYVEKITESRLVTQPQAFDTKSSIKDYNYLFQENQSQIKKLKQKLVLTTDIFNWKRLNLLAVDFNQGKLSLADYVSQTKSLIDQFSLKGRGIDLLLKSVEQIETIENSQQRINYGIKRLNSKNKVATDIISKKTRVPLIESNKNRLVLNTLFGAEIVLLLSILVFAQRLVAAFNDLENARKLSRKLELDFSLQTGFVSTVFDLEGRCLIGGSHLNQLLNKLKSDSDEFINDWSLVAELVGLHNTYSLKDLPEGVHRIEVSARDVLGKSINYEIVFDLNLDSKRVGILFKQHLEVENKVSTSVETADLSKLKQVNINDTVSEIILEMSHYITAKGVKVSFNALDDLFIRVNEADFQLRMKGLLQVIIQNLTESNELKEIKISAIKIDNLVNMSFLLDGKELNSQLLIGDMEGASLEKEISLFEQSFSDLNARVSIRNNYDSKDIFMFSEIGLEIPDLHGPA